MFELTEDARNLLHTSLKKADGPEKQGRCFRVVPKDDKFLTLKLATPTPSDTVFTHKGDEVLAMPKALQPFFEGKCLDIDDSGKLKLC
jgi:hypothetical protein